MPQYDCIVAGGDCGCWQTGAETRVQGYSRHSEHHQTRRRYYLSDGCGLNFIMPSTLLDRPLIISKIASFFIILSSYPHLARGSPNVKKNTHPVFQHISHLWYILMMTHCVGTSNSGGILIFSLSFSKYC